jgi:hypothetical protein
MTVNESFLNMKPKIYTILSQAVEEGVKRGYRRAFKHIESPSEEDVTDSIDSAVMASILEYFIFDSEFDD